MDPLSITVAALTIASRVIPAAHQIYGVWNQYQEAPQTIADLVDELHLVRACLAQLEQILRQEGVSITSDLEDVFAIAVKGCRATLLCVDEEFGRLQGRQDWWSRILVLWNEGDMARLMTQLARKKSSIMLLMQCLNLGTAYEIRHTLQQHRPELQAARADLSALVVSYPQFTAPIIESLDRATIASMAGSRESTISDTEFAFDFELVNTRVYRENLQRLRGGDGVQSRRRAGTSSIRPSSPSTSSDSTLRGRVPTPPIGDLIDLSSDVEEEIQVRPPPTPHPDLEGLYITTTWEVSALTDARDPEGKVIEPVVEDPEQNIDRLPRTDEAKMQLVEFDVEDSASISRQPTTDSIAKNHGTSSDGSMANFRRRVSRKNSSDTLASSSTSLVSPATPPTPQYKISSSINNPKLPRTVEDAIQRLILSEVKALKEEQRLAELKGKSPSSSRSPNAKASGLEQSADRARPSERRERRSIKRGKGEALPAESLSSAMNHRWGHLGIAEQSGDDAAAAAVPTIEVTNISSRRKGDPIDRKLRRRKKYISPSLLAEDGSGSDSVLRNHHRSRTQTHAPDKRSLKLANMNRNDGDDEAVQEKSSIKATTPMHAVAADHSFGSDIPTYYTPKGQETKGPKAQSQTATVRGTATRSNISFLNTIDEDGIVRMRRRNYSKGENVVDTSRAGNTLRTTAPSPPLHSPEETSTNKPSNPGNRTGIFGIPKNFSLV